MPNSLNHSIDFRLQLIFTRALSEFFEPNSMKLLDSFIGCAAGISLRGRTYTPVEITTGGFQMLGLLCGCFLRFHSLEHFLVSLRDLYHMIITDIPRKFEITYPGIGVIFSPVFFTS